MGNPVEVHGGQRLVDTSGQYYEFKFTIRDGVNEVGSFEPIEPDRGGSDRRVHQGFSRRNEHIHSQKDDRRK